MFEPFLLNSATLTIDGDAYEGQISGAVFTPTTNTVPWTAINGSTYNFSTPSTWVLDLTYAQELNDAAALARYLHENEGASVTAVFTPKDGGPALTATISIAPGAIGAADPTTVAGSTVSLGSTKPVLGAIIP
jgi:hypothetical protein